MSYSHADSHCARWLHRRLETYRVPKSLVGRKTPLGTVPARLTPIFRDREELPASTDLNDEVRTALTASASLIVLCSPAAARSRWVNLEIETFRRLAPGRPILAAIIRGADASAMPPALRADPLVEPLAADMNTSGDGRRLALLKLVAGATAVPLDALTQREAQRRLRRVTAVTVGALIAMIVLAALTVSALRAKAEAQVQRNQAEGLVEYMLTDLRDKLKGVGRLDVMTSANRRALRYYADQSIGVLPPASLLRRAALLQAMGEDELARDDVPQAQSLFEEAARTTASVLRRAPSDPERLFADAQSRYWLGSAAWQRKDYAAAERHFLDYARLARALNAIAPGNVRFIKEPAYAAGNLCTLLYSTRRDPARMLRLCGEALAGMQAALRLTPGDPQTIKDVANRHGWLADALRRNGRLAEALAERRAEARLVGALSAANPEDVRYQLLVIWSQRAQAKLEMALGQPALARDRLARAIDALERILVRDPEAHSDRDELREMRNELLSKPQDRRLS